MIGQSIKELCQVVDGTLQSGPAELWIEEVSTDSREITPGVLFIALVGEKFNGHSFVEKAVTLGAKAVLISEEVQVPQGIAVIRVGDTLRALQLIASHNRQIWRKPIIAVTGSNGKTSTKDLLAAVLGTQLQVLKTQGNFNNEIGLPLTLLQLSANHQVGVVEMGMRGLGEISLLAEIARPNVGVITNIGETHLERLGTIENIAQAKGELLDHLHPEGVAVLNGDDPLVRAQARRYTGEKIFYGFGEQNSLRVIDAQLTGTEHSRFRLTWQGEEHEIELGVPGKHNILNALAAIAVGRHLGISWPQIKSGLAAAQLTGMRLQVMKLAQGTIINDVYNANPASTVAALEVLQEVGQKARKIAILGSMFELGSREKTGHLDVGRSAGAVVDYLITVGDLAEGIAQGAMEVGLSRAKVRSFERNQQVINFLKTLVAPEDVILVKGSRGMKLEEVVAELQSMLQ